MFIWDFVTETVPGQIIDWIYGQIVGFLGDFFMQTEDTGADLFTMSWMWSVVLFFSYLAQVPYVTGLVVAVFEYGIDYQTGRGSVKEATLNAIRGSLIASLFITAPVELYKLYVSLQGSFTAGIIGLGGDFGIVVVDTVNFSKDAGTWEAAATPRVFGELTSITSPVLMMLILILMGHAIIKVLFANLKRSGTLLIQVVAGSLHVFDVPRGYIDGFVSWSKQVIGLCLTAFLQTTVLVARSMVVKDQALLGLGLMLSAGEIPRIAGQFDLSATTRANVMGAVYAIQGAANLTRAIMQTVAK